MFLFVTVIRVTIPNGGVKITMKSAIIVAPDNRGLQPLCGIPVAVRLVLILRKLGFEAIHLIGGAETLQPVLSNLIPPHSFLPADLPDSAASAAERLDIPLNEPVLVLRANHVVDHRSLELFLKAGAGKTTAFMSGQGNLNGDGAYIAFPSHLATVIHTQSMTYSAMAWPADWEHLEKLGQSLKSIRMGTPPSVKTASPP